MSLAPDSNVDISAASSINSVVARDQKGTLRTDAHKLYSFAAAAWLTILATPLLLFPRVLSLIFGSLLTPSGTPEAEGAAEVIRQLNPLERALSGLTGLSCLTLGIILIIQTGAVPLTSSINSHAAPDALFRVPTVITTTLFFSALAWFSYDLGFWLVAGVSGGLSGWGLWAVLFATESNINKEGAKKNVSSYPFKNEHAEEKKEL